MKRLLHWLGLRRTRTYQGREMYGPFLPWDEVLRQATTKVPRP